MEEESIFASFQVFAFALKKIGSPKKNLKKYMSNLNSLNRDDLMSITY